MLVADSTAAIAAANIVSWMGNRCGSWEIERPFVKVLNYSSAHRASDPKPT